MTVQLCHTESIACGALLGRTAKIRGRRRRQTGGSMEGFASIDKLWLSFYSEEAINGSLPEQSIFQYMYDNNKDYPDDIAIVYQNKKITYREMFHHIDQCSRSLTALGIGPGDIVTVALPSIPEVLYLVYAINRVGAVANMIHPLAGESETLFYIKEVKSRVVFLFDQTAEVVKDSVWGTGVEKAVMVSAVQSLSPLFRIVKKKKLPGFMDWKEFLSAGKETIACDVLRDVHEMAIISHTGGTTGEPKGVMCSDYNINALIWQLQYGLTIRRQDRNMAVLPPFINYSLVNSMLAPILYGLQAILIPDYHPDQFDKYVKKYQPNIISSIPDYWEAVLTNERLRYMNLSCLDQIFYGGEAMNPSKQNEINRFLRVRGARHDLEAGFGATEMVSAAVMTYPEIHEPGCAGIPLVKVNCCIVEPGTTRELPYGQIGEICFTGPNMMLGYYKNPQATNDVIWEHPDKTRWLHMGDLGYITDRGVIFVTGRLKRIAITVDENRHPTKLFPERIENVVMQHPAVDICCVTCVPDPKRVNYARAYVVLNKGFAPSEQTRNELKQLCVQHLPAYMIPEEIVFKDQLPRTERGKVDYRALEKQEKAPA